MNSPQPTHWKLCATLLAMLVAIGCGDDDAGDAAVHDTSADVGGEGGPQFDAADDVRQEAGEDALVDSADTNDARAADVMPDAAVCNAAESSPGFVTRMITVAGEEREFQLYIPEGASDLATPVVFVFHGRGSSSQGARGFGFDSAADAAGDNAIFVFPSALPYPGQGATGWEISCDGYDMQFVDAMLDLIEAELCVDPARVFATGFSWGADMTIATGCCRHERFRAIGPIAGTAWGPWRESCLDEAPAYRAEIGTDDGFYTLENVQSTTDHYRSVNRCAESSTTVSGEPECEAYDACDGRVIQCVREGLGHSIGPDAAAQTWAFFDSFQ